MKARYHASEMTECAAAPAGRDREDSDGGELRVKEHLPVRQLRFGDTGVLADAKHGVFRLGALVCEGDGQCP